MKVDLIQGALVIAAERVPAALEALAATGELDEQPGTLRGLQDLGFAVHPRTACTEPLIVNGFHGRLEAAAEAAVIALAPFVEADTTLDWEDDNGERWRYLIAGGQVIEQVPTVIWRDRGDRTSRNGGVLAPLTITRDTAGYARWWAQTTNQEDIIAALESIMEAEPGDLEYALHHLLLAVFQDVPGAVEWLHVAGLGRGVAVRYLSFDIDPSHDSEGIIDGVEVVLNLVTDTMNGPLRVAVYVDRARAVLAPLSADDPPAALAEVIDIALELINRDIAARDRFTFAARDVLVG